MIKLRKKYKELNLLVKTKRYKTIYANTCTFLIQKKFQQWGKKTPKNIIFYTLLLVVYSTDNHKQLLQ